MNDTPRKTNSQKAAAVKREIVEGVASGKPETTEEELAPQPPAPHPPNTDIIDACQMILELAQSGHVQGLAAAFALGPEHAGKVLVHGHLHQTLAGTCMVMASQLSAEPFMDNERQAQEALAAKARAEGAKPEAVT